MFDYKSFDIDHTAAVIKRKLEQGGADEILEVHRRFAEIVTACWGSGHEKAALRAALKKRMKREDWLEFCTREDPQILIRGHGRQGDRLEEISRLIGENKTSEAKARLEELAQVLPDLWESPRD